MFVVFLCCQYPINVINDFSTSGTAKGGGGGGGGSIGGALAPPITLNPKHLLK